MEENRDHLAFKVNLPYDRIGREHPAVNRLRDHASDCPSASLFTRLQRHDEALRLYASADVIVSLHRAEGLALVPLEGMALGKPALVTGWSGNMAYMDHLSACLVSHRLVPVQGSGGLYEQLVRSLPTVWAEPDLKFGCDVGGAIS